MDTRVPFMCRFVAIEAAGYLKFAGLPLPEGEVPLQYNTKMHCKGSHWVKISWRDGLRYTAAVESLGEDRWRVASITIRMPSGEKTDKAIELLEEYTGVLPKFHTEKGRTIVIDEEQLKALQACIECVRFERQLPMKWADEDNQFRKAMEVEEERVRMPIKEEAP